MKIKFKDAGAVTFNNIMPGELFMYRDTPYIKLEGGTLMFREHLQKSLGIEYVQAICVIDGIACSYKLTDGTAVFRINGKFVEE